MKTTYSISTETHRPYILVTLAHTERRERIEPKRIAEIFKKLFHCKSIVIGREKHKELGEHLHIAIYNYNASRYNAVKRIRQAFPQFEGRQCHIQFHKGLNYMLAYVTKEDKDPYVEGEIDKTKILEIAENARNKKKAGRTPAKLLLKALRDCQKWEDVYEHDELLDRIVYGSHRNLKTIYQEIQIIKESKMNPISRIRWYLDDRKVDSSGVKEYIPEELQEKYVLLDWIAVNLLYQRPLKTKQLLLYGEPSTQKTLLMQILKNALRIYFVGTRMNDFSGADDHYDMWVFDEYTSNEKRDFNGNVQYSEAASAYNRTILRILDGQECRLDAKYNDIFRKTRNIPIILIANEIPRECVAYGPLQERLMRLRFHTRIEHLDEKRIVKTLMGCIRRRIHQQIQCTEEQRKHLLLYNQEQATYTQIKHQMSEHHLLFQLKTEQGQELILQFNTKERISLLLLDPESYENTIMTTLKYALIPLEQQKKTLDTIKHIDSLIHAPPFSICREPNYEGMKQYLTWPVHLRFLSNNKLLSAEVRVATTEEKQIIEHLLKTHGNEKNDDNKLLIRIGPENEYTFTQVDGSIVWTDRD